MHGHVIAHREHFAVGIVDGTRIIAAFFDIRGKRGTPENCAHFFGNGMENIFKYFQPRRVGFANRFTHKILCDAPIIFESARVDRSYPRALSNPAE